jgi:hypothetical protein
MTPGGFCADWNSSARRLPRGSSNCLSAQLLRWRHAATRTIGRTFFWSKVWFRLMAARFVKPFRKNPLGKTDPNNAEAIATAARQSIVCFVPIMDIDQQARLVG